MTIIMKKKIGKLRKILLSVAAVLVAAIIVCVSISAIGNAANKSLIKKMNAVSADDVLIPYLDAETGYQTFKTDRDFRILQLTDIHIGGGFMSIGKDAKAINAVADLVTFVKPDLVIITGDMVYPVPIFAGTFNNITSTKMFTSLMEKLGVYWTVAFGNHDSEVYSYYNREELSEIYSDPDLKYCLYDNGPADVDGYGNSVINVVNGSDIITQSIFTFDSHSYIKGFRSEYDNIHENQIVWYENEVERLDGINRQRGADSMFKSITFFHIPLKEFKTALDEYNDNNRQDTENVKLIYGSAGETPCIGVGTDNLFSVMQRLGSTHGVFVGHDHVNNFSIDYTTEGYEDSPIRLTYGMSIDHLAYFGISKKTAQRGGTVITVTPDGDMSCYGLRLVNFEIIT